MQLKHIAVPKRSPGVQKVDFGITVVLVDTKHRELARLQTNMKKQIENN